MAVGWALLFAAFLSEAFIAIPVEFQIVSDNMKIPAGNRGDDILERAVFDRHHRMAVNTHRIVCVFVPVPLKNGHCTVSRHNFEDCIFFDKSLQYTIDS
jgi:hypothetical protein